MRDSIAFSNYLLQSKVHVKTQSIEWPCTIAPILVRKQYHCCDVHFPICCIVWISRIDVINVKEGK